MKIVLVGPSIGQSEGGILYSGGNELVTSSGPHYIRNPNRKYIFPDKTRQ